MATLFLATTNLLEAQSQPASPPTDGWTGGPVNRHFL